MSDQRQLSVWRTLASRPVEITCAVAMTVAGIALTASSTRADEPSVAGAVGGGVLTALGGVLLSWVLSASFTKREAQADMFRQLDTVSRALGQASGQISRAVERTRGGEISADVSLALISQAATSIYGQVNEIQVMIGNKFDSADLLETVSQLDDLATQLGERGSAGRDAEEELQQVKERLGHMRTELSRSGYVARTSSEAAVACPHCGSHTVATLGDTPGDTAAAFCRGCRARFNVHRRPDGGVLTRPMKQGASSVAPARVFAIPCPSCSNEMNVSVHGTDGTKHLVCWNCLAHLTLDVESRAVTQQGTYVPTPSIVKSWTAGRPVVTCPACTQSIRAIFRWGDGGFCGACHRDELLLTVDSGEVAAHDSLSVSADEQGPLKAVPTEPEVSDFARSAGDVP